MLCLDLLVKVRKLPNVFIQPRLIILDNIDIFNVRTKIFSVECFNNDVFVCAQRLNRIAFERVVYRPKNSVDVLQIKTII